MFITDAVFALVKNKATVKAQWDTLRTKFETHTAANQLNLLSKLINTRCVEGGNVHEVFDQLADIHQQLLMANVTITDKEYATVLCNCLPSSYELTVDTITAVGETKTITSDIVIKFALEAYNHKVAKGEVDTQSLALAAQTGGKNYRKRKANDTDNGRGRNNNARNYHQGGQSVYDVRGASYNAQGGLTSGGQGHDATSRSRELPVCWNC